MQDYDKGFSYEYPYYDSKFYKGEFNKFISLLCDFDIPFSISKTSDCSTRVLIIPLSDKLSLEYYQEDSYWSPKPQIRLKVTG